MKTFRIFFSFIIVIGAVNHATAQVEATQYLMNSLPQYVSNNPAFIPKYKFAIGLPGSMVSGGYYNSGFSFNDVLNSVNGEKVVVLDKFFKTLPKRSFITATTETDLFRFGLLIKPGVYLSVNSSVRGYGQMMLPKDLAGLFANGNAAYVGSTLSLAPSAHLSTWWENAVGLSVSPIENFTFGGRIKMLKGIVNVHSETADLSMTVADNYAITVAADLMVKSSNVQGMDELNGLASFNNNGWAGDLGATWKPISKLTVAASLLDIGAIKWKANTYAYTLDKTKATYTFEGLDMKRLADGDSDYINDELDSVVNHFEPAENPTGAYVTGLPTRFFASGSYDVVKNFTVTSAVFAQRYPGRLSTGWVVGFNKHFGRVLSTTVTYSVTNRSYNNLGAGISFNLAPIQLYLVGDNLLRAPISIAASGKANNFVNGTQVFNFRMGLNFVWGWTRAKQDANKGKSPNSAPDSGDRATSDVDKQPKPGKVKRKR